MSSKKLKPKPVVAPMLGNLRELTRRKVRYWCFRFKTEEVEFVPCTDAPAGLKGYFESLEWFSGWKQFAVTWDVRDESPLSIKPLKESSEVAWDRVLLEESKELPGVKLR